MSIDSIDFLDDATSFKRKLEQLPQSDDEKRALLENLETFMKSSAWATKILFKPGIRNFYMQEQLRVQITTKQFEHFLGDQEYLFKFFFQNFFSRGELPGVVDLLKQGINLPSFRFRLDSIDMLVELDAKGAILLLFNLVSGLDQNQPDACKILSRIEAGLDDLATACKAAPKFKKIFDELRFLMARFTLEASTGA
ncbi:MAG TPA: hypothetical protein VKM55_25695 [Candidatus Lokiarchaeia archaeon]|nr:hypothetical protein [Candidatus Lokiarchaeia archaeon]